LDFPKWATQLKAVTHVIALGGVAVVGFAATPAGQAVIHQYPKLAAGFAAIGVLMATYHDPNKA
jgi:hypothetical protein